MSRLPGRWGGVVLVLLLGACSKPAATGSGSPTRSAESPPSSDANGSNSEPTPWFSSHQGGTIPADWIPGHVAVSEAIAGTRCTSLEEGWRWSSASLTDAPDGPRLAHSYRCFVDGEVAPITRALSAKGLEFKPSLGGPLAELEDGLVTIAEEPAMVLVVLLRPESDAQLLAAFTTTLPGVGAREEMFGGSGRKIIDASFGRITGDSENASALVLVEQAPAQRLPEALVTDGFAKLPDVPADDTKMWTATEGGWELTVSVDPSPRTDHPIAAGTHAVRLAATRRLGPPKPSVGGGVSMRELTERIEQSSILCELAEDLTQDGELEEAKRLDAWRRAASEAPVTNAAILAAVERAVGAGATPEAYDALAKELSSLQSSKWDCPDLKSLFATRPASR